jgi:hypothetical protein
MTDEVENKIRNAVAAAINRMLNAPRFWEAERVAER